jgi:hypothetical protein
MVIIEDKNIKMAGTGDQIIKELADGLVKLTKEMTTSGQATEDKIIEKFMARVQKKLIKNKEDKGGK